MEISIKYQLLSTIYSIILGFFAGLIYDFTKILRKALIGDISLKVQHKFLKIKLPLINLRFNNFSLNFRKKLVYFIFDILFFLILTPIMLIFTFAVSSGVLRWYIIIGALLGFICYYFTVSKIVIIIYEYIAVTIKIILLYFLHFFKIPLFKLKHEFEYTMKKVKIKRELRIEKRIKKDSKENRHLVLYNYKK